MEKKCPFCGEMIKFEAKKCRYCGEWLESKNGEQTSSGDTTFVNTQLPTNESMSPKNDSKDVINHSVFQTNSLGQIITECTNQKNSSKENKSESNNIEQISLNETSPLNSHTHENESVVCENNSVNTESYSVEQFKAEYTTQMDSLNECKSKLDEELEKLKNCVFEKLSVLKNVSNQKDAYFVENRALDFFKKMKLEEKIKLNPKEEIIFIRDTSFFNNLSSGLVISNYGIHIIETKEILAWSAIKEIIRENYFYVFNMTSDRRIILNTTDFCKGHDSDSFFSRKVLKAMNETIAFFKDLVELENIINRKQKTFNNLVKDFKKQHPNDYKEFISSLTETVSEQEVIKACTPYIISSYNLPIRRTPYINKHGDQTKVSISQFINENEGENGIEMLMDLAKYEQIANSILEITAMASEKCKAVQEVFSNISEQLMEIGIKNLAGKNQKIGKYAVVGAGALKVAETAVGIYNEWKADKEERERERLLLKYKQKVAKEKYVFTAKTLIEMTHKMKRYESLYLNEFNKIINPDNEHLDCLIKIFHRSFSIYIKMEYLRMVLAFVVSEMRAWKYGMDGSDAELPDIDTIIEREIRNWPQRLIKGQNSVTMPQWDNFLLMYMRGEGNQENSGIPVPILLLFNSPYLLRNYVGITSDLLIEKIDLALLENDNCNYFDSFRKQFLIEALKDNPRKKIQEKLKTVTNPISNALMRILNENDYYKDFQSLRKENVVKFSRSGCFWGVIFFFIFMMLCVSISEKDMRETLWTIIFGTIVEYVLPLVVALYWWEKRKYQKKIKIWDENMKIKENELAEKYNKF